ncbi:MAG: glutathione S-transferase [Hyphomicrobiales bacterium]
MAKYILHCMGESGNAYKVALMLALTGSDWEPRLVDYFGGETRTPEFRSERNALGEVPVLEHRGKTLSQSGVILDYLAETTGRYGPTSNDERREILRWTLFDNHKFTSYVATLRFLTHFRKMDAADPVVTFFRDRALTAYGLVDKHLRTRPYLVGDRLTIADLSLVGYCYYDGELGFEIGQFEHITPWLARIRATPGWKGPYDLMPRSYKG